MLFQVIQGHGFRNQQLIYLHTVAANGQIFAFDRGYLSNMFIQREPLNSQLQYLAPEN